MLDRTFLASLSRQRPADEAHAINIRAIGVPGCSPKGLDTFISIARRNIGVLLAAFTRPLFADVFSMLGIFLFLPISRNHRRP